MRSRCVPLGHTRYAASIVSVLPHDLSRSRGQLSDSPHGPQWSGLSGARGGRASAGGAAMSAYGGPAAPPEPPRRYDPAGAGPAGPPSAAMRARLDRGGCVSVSAVYADINVHRPPAYWDYDMMSVPWGSVSQRLSSSVCVCAGGGKVLKVDVMRLGLAWRAMGAGFLARAVGAVVTLFFSVLFKAVPCVPLADALPRQAMALAHWLMVFGLGVLSIQSCSCSLVVHLASAVYFVL